MHDSSEGLVVAVSPAGAPGLLIEETPSDVCLRCHGSEEGAVLGTNPLAPPPERGAGNFVFLFETNLNDAPDGASNIIPGDTGGHNLVAPGHGLAADTRHSLSPGGSFPAGEMGCTSCHDPHGNDGFRHLHGTGPVQGGLEVFSYPAPDAEGIALDGAGESGNNHTAYRGGMSDWCGNCHGQYHDDIQTPVVPGGGEPLEHPSDQPMDGQIRSRYNAYNGDDDPLGGTVATAYLTAAPFEDRSNTTTSSSGPGGGGRVMCLTCHRAHATSSPAALRWDFRVAFLDLDGAVSGSYPIPNPYLSPTQGTLCSKCHEGGAPAPSAGPLVPVAPPPAPG
jgi:cytochrome c553